MDDLIAEFITETSESLGELDIDLIKLEQNPNDKDLLSNIFRLMHTIKGTCGFLGLPRLEKVAHHAENVLGRFRDGELEVTQEYVTLILESIDRIKYIVSTIEDTGSEPDGDDQALIEQLDVVYEGKSVADMPEETPEDPQGLSNDAPDDKEEAKKEAEPEANMQAKESTLAAQSLRVNVDVLENLMTMVSELVLTRNQLLQTLRQHSESEFTAPLQRLNHVVSDLQEGVMQTRMQPIGNAWAKLPRIIRDITLDLGKKIDLQMHGQDTELDRQVLEMIKDPLTHMVRNSADHGVEMPEDRLAAGKPETGKIVLNAFHEGGHIIIEIKDDGKGLSTEKIRKKIIDNGLATAEELNELSAQQLQQFIFKPGFSTAEKVTSVSGRGVGMDVVRTNIEKIGGSVELKSQEGVGSTFRIKIPLTLAIVSALIIESAGERFAIPQLSVRELVMAGGENENKIEMIRGTPVFRLRDRLLPLVSLSKLLKLRQDDILAEKHDTERPINTSEYKNQYIIVTQVGAYNFGVLVDRVYDTEEIVVKPVANIIRDIDLFSGNTILGDGSVIMILDPNGVAKATGEVEVSDNDAAFDTHIRPDKAKEKTSLILFTAGQGAPKTVPLALVSRLEMIKREHLEQANGQTLIQYRGKLMPIIPFDPQTDIHAKEEFPLLVFTDGDQVMGLAVEEIVDIKDEVIDVQIDGHVDGLIGTAVIDDKATDVIDVGYFITSVRKDWFGEHHGQPYSKSRSVHDAGVQIEPKKILLVDDSPFFRNMLTPILTMAGYEVTAFDSAEDALKRFEDGSHFDLVISDIEMPDMDGFEFVEKLKASNSLSQIPVLALSSHATEEDKKRGLQAGFTDHVAKFDRDSLLSILNNTFNRAESSNTKETL